MLSSAKDIPGTTRPENQSALNAASASDIELSTHRRRYDLSPSALLQAEDLRRTSP